MIIKNNVIPQNWELLKLSKVGEVIGGGTPDTKNEDYWGGDISWVTPTEITHLNGKYILSTLRRITRLGLEKSSARLIPSNSLLLTSRASIGYCAINKTEICTNQGFQNIVPNKWIKVDFLYYMMQSHLAQRQLARSAYGSTFREVPNKDMKKIKILVPSIPEQQKITSYLSKLDDIINLTRKIIDQLQALKKGLMQCLFSEGIGHTEFKEMRLGRIPKEWEILKIRNVVNKKDGLKRGPWGGSVKKEYFVPSGYKVYEQKCIIKNNFTLGHYYIDEKKFQELKQFEIKSGDLLMTAAGTLGRFSIVPLGIEPGIFNQAIIRIRINEDVMKKLFFKYLFESDYLLKIIRRFTFGSAIQNFASINILSSIPMPVPSLSEQQKIIDILTSCDSKIKSEVLYKERLKKTKKGLMQDLLTGKKRVKIN